MPIIKRVTLTEEQYQTAQIALGMLDAGDEESAAQNEDAVRAFANNVETFGELSPEAKIAPIPIFLHMGDRHPVGFGHFEDGLLVIKTHSILLSQAIDRLTRTEHIKELYLGVGFPMSQGVSIETPSKAHG